MKSAKRQQAILDFVQTFIDQHGYAPSRREIMRGLGISTTSLVTHHLWKLRNAGRLTWTEGAARSLRVVERKAT